MISSLLGLRFRSCVQEQYFKHGLRNNSTYAFDKNNLEFASFIGMRVFFPPATAVTDIFSDHTACCLVDALFQSKCLFQLIE